jgi:hypothetical protein
VFLLCDQSYPPLLPAHGRQLCIKIIRVENGSIASLTSEFLNIVRGYTLGEGSLVLIFSAAHMATAGTIGYIEDLLSASAQIRSVLGQHILVAPAPPLFTSGCKNAEVIRICAKISAWIAGTYYEEEEYLADSFILANEAMVGENDDDAQDDHTIRMRLPASNDPRKGKRTWIMAGFYVKKIIKPADSGMEAEIVLSIIEGIRSRLAIDLDPSPSFDRRVEIGARSSSSNKEKIYLVVGGTHALYLGEAMRRKGCQADVVTLRGWRAQKKSVDILVEKLKLAMDVRKPDTVVIQCLDDNIFLTQAEDGT